MKILFTLAVAATSAQAQSFKEPAFAAPEIPATRGLYTLSAKSLGCAPTDAKSAVGRCEFRTDAGPARMNTLVLSGSLKEIAYQHGLRLAEEIESGSLTEALDNIGQLKARFKNKPVLLAAIDSLIGCYVDRIKSSVDREFRDATLELARGYEDGMMKRGKQPKYHPFDLETATYSIELGNIFGTLFDNVKHRPVKTVARVLRECGKDTFGGAIDAALQEIARQGEPRELLRNDFACTGAVLPASMSRDGHLYHARNLEQTAMIESWNRNPVTFLVHERGYAKYVAFGTAGLIFPGGISGYNEHQIAVSTHQMEGTTYGSGYPGNAAMGPYLQQMILREAKSIDDAVRIAKRVKSFSAWTILVSDAKTGESASIEVTSEGADVSRRRRDRVMGQSNYFFLPKNQELQFHENYNSYLETVARVNVVETALGAGKPGLEEIVGTLASHLDWFEGERSFGRSVSRVMNIMSTIASPSQNKVWVTVSDRFPSSQGFYLEYDVDFRGMRLIPGRAIRTRDQELRPNFEKSFAAFQRAYRANHAGDAKAALAHVREADRLARIDGVVDPAYQYVIGRLLLADGQYTEAESYLEGLLRQGVRLHPLKIANLKSLLLYAHQRTGLCRRERKLCRDYFRDASATYDAALKGDANSAWFPLAPGGYVPAKSDLEKKKNFLTDLIRPKKRVKLPSLDLRTMD